MRQYVVRPGDTLYVIAQIFSTNVSTILSLNPLLNPIYLSIGQLIIIPDPSPSTLPTIYTIKYGDNLNSIARRYRVTTSFILSINPQISDPTKIYIGQKIILPPLPQSPDYAIYIIQNGDTINKISTRFSVTVDSILKLNPQIINPIAINIGQTLLLDLTSLSNISVDGCLLFYTIEGEGVQLWMGEINTFLPNAYRLPIPQNIALSPTPPKLSFFGEYIAYMTTDLSTLNVTDNCGKNIRTLVNNVYSFSWSRPGARLAISSSHGFYVAVPFSEYVNVLTPQESGIINRTDWFPDDRRIAGAQPYRPVGVSNFQNYLVIIDSESKKIKTYNNPLIPADNLKVSNDGKYIAVTGVLYEGAPPRITDFSSPYLFEVATEKLTKLPGFNATSLGWSPDSSKLVYSAQPTNTPTGNRDKILIVSPDGTIQKTLQGLGYRKLAVGWSPYPDWIYFRSEDQPPYVPASYITTSMFVMNIQTGQQYKLPSTWTEDAWISKKCTVCR